MGKAERNKTRWLDEKGRLWGKLSVLDLVVVLAVIGCVLGFLYKQTSREVQQIVNANTPFYVTFKCEKLRMFNVDALSEGDIFYKRYERQALGKVVALSIAQGEDILLKTDGTALLAPTADRYTAYVTLACSGSVTDEGYYVNGSLLISEGSEFQIQSNRLMANASVYAIGDTLPE